MQINAFKVFAITCPLSPATASAVLNWPIVRISKLDSVFISVHQRQLVVLQVLSLDRL